MSKEVSGKFIALSNGFSYYEDQNPNSKKETLVMIHGFSVPSYIWEETFQSAVKKGFRVIRMDLFGRGYSENPDVAYTDALFANQVLELLERLNVSKASFLGLSNGGRVISKIAFLNKEIVSRLIYVSSSGFSEKTPPENRSVSASEIEAFISTYPTIALGQMADFNHPEEFPDWSDKYDELLVYKGFARALISTQKNHVTLDTEHKFINKSGIPVYTIWGESDQAVVYASFKSRLAKLLPNRNETFIKYTGHLPHMENPQTFNALLFETILKD